MLSFVARSSTLSPYMKATTAVVSNVKPILGPLAVLPASSVVPPPVEKHTADALRANAPRSGVVRSTSAILSSASVRYAHTDIRVPDFSDYRRKDVQDPTSRNKDSAAARNSFTYLIVGGK